MATIEPWLTNLLNKAQTPDLPPIQLVPLGAAPAYPLSLPPLGSEIPGSHKADPLAPTQIASLCAVDEDRSAKAPVRPEDTSVLHTSSIRPLQLLLREPEPAAAPTIPLAKIVDDVPLSPEDATTKKRNRAPATKEDYVQLPKLPKKRKSAQQVVPPIIAGLHEPPPDPAVFPPITSASFVDETFNLAGAWKDAGSGAEDRAAPSSAADAAGPGSAPKQKRRPMKPRRKWTEAETNHLLLGVSRHGVGRWTSILEDPEFQFNGRTAGDLKDRFRTCCPEELRLTTAEEHLGYAGESGTASTPDSSLRHKGGLQLEDILIPTGDITTENDGASPSALHPDSDVGSKRRRPRAHRKKLEDLAELGIHGPFEKSHRRRRRAFTRQDDEAILDGLKQYGPSWTRIQRDPKYNLASRQPTDLRDRVRNKYPDIYANIEKANLLKEAARDAARGKAGDGNTTTSGSSSNTLEPSLRPSMESLRAGFGVLLPSAQPSSSQTSLPASASASSTSLEHPQHHPQQQQEQLLNRSTSREDMNMNMNLNLNSMQLNLNMQLNMQLLLLRRTTATPSAAFESTESLPALADLMFDVPVDTQQGYIGGFGTSSDMMDLSHLLLDDSGHVGGGGGGGYGYGSGNGYGGGSGNVYGSGIGQGGGGGGERRFATGRGGGLL